MLVVGTFAGWGRHCHARGEKIVTRCPLALEFSWALEALATVVVPARQPCLWSAGCGSARPRSAHLDTLRALGP